MDREYHPVVNRPRAFLVPALVAALLVPRSSAASNRDECARAYETAQRSRLDGKLVESRKDLLVCAQDECPPVLRKDCAAWLAELDSQMPTVALRVVGSDGCDHPEATIAIDGAIVPHAAEGLAFPLDPGPHVIRATLGDGPKAVSMEQKTVIAANERQRTVTLTFGNATTCGQPPATTPLPPPPPPPPRTTEQKPIPTSIFVLGGLSIAAIGVSTGFSISGWHQKSILDECKGSCAQHDVDTMRRTFAVADLTGAVAIGALLAAGILYFTR